MRKQRLRMNEIAQGLNAPTKWGRQIKIKQCPWAKNILILVGEDRQARTREYDTKVFTAGYVHYPRLQHTSTAAAAEICSGIIYFFLFLPLYSCHNFSSEFKQTFPLFLKCDLPLSLWGPVSRICPILWQ